MVILAFCAIQQNELLYADTELKTGKLISSSSSPFLPLCTHACMHMCTLVYVFVTHCFLICCFFFLKYFMIQLTLGICYTEYDVS